MIFIYIYDSAIKVDIYDSAIKVDIYDSAIKVDIYDSAIKVWGLSSQFFDAFKQLAGCCQHSPLGTLRISHLRSGAEYEHRVTRCRTSDLEALQSAAQMGG